MTGVMDTPDTMWPELQAQPQMTPDAARGTHTLEQTSGFFELSAELRNMVYEYLDLAEGDVLWVIANNHSGSWDIGPCPIPPPTTQVCSLMRSEMLSIYFGVNAFSISLLCEKNVSMAQQWVHAIGKAGAMRLRKLRLRGYAWSDSGDYTTSITLNIRHQPGVSPTSDGKQSDKTPGSTFFAAREELVVDGHALTVDRLRGIIENFASRCAFRRGKVRRPPALRG